MNAYKVKFEGRKRTEHGIFYAIEENYHAASESDAKDKCLKDDRFELNHFIGEPELLATEEPTL